MLNTPSIGLAAAKSAMGEDALVENSGGVSAYVMKSGAIYPMLKIEEETPGTTKISSSHSLLNNIEDVFCAARDDFTLCASDESNESSFDDFNKVHDTHKATCVTIDEG